MASFSKFGATEMMALRSKLRSEFAAGEPTTFEGAAARLVLLFRNEFRDSGGVPECALARIYKTHRFDGLPDDLKSFARNLERAADSLPELRCLVLMATAGDEEAWNSRFASRDHRAIPLTSEPAVLQAPMVAQLIRQLGVPITSVIRPDPALLLDVRERAQNVFYVPEALGSPFIVAQETFVKRYGIRSVIGFGGMLASGELVVAILFSKAEISEAVAQQFKVIGLNFKLAMLPFARRPTFAD